MLDRVTHRKDLREELITITRMLMGLSPAVMGDLPPPGRATGPEGQDTPPAPEPKQP
jgi:acetyl-CoA carboxylase carboxyl transferase subunit beta